MENLILILMIAIVVLAVIVFVLSIINDQLRNQINQGRVMLIGMPDLNGSDGPGCGAILTVLGLLAAIFTLAAKMLTS